MCVAGTGVYLSLQLPLCGTHLHFHQIWAHDLFTESTAPTRVCGKEKHPHRPLRPTAAHILFVLSHHTASSEEVNEKLSSSLKLTLLLWDSVHSYSHRTRMPIATRHLTEATPHAPQQAPGSDIRPPRRLP